MTARRPVLAGLALALPGGRAPAGTGPVADEATPFGMIGKVSAATGKRGELVAILGSGTGAMPGCLAYLIAGAGVSRP